MYADVKYILRNGIASDQNTTVVFKYAAKAEDRFYNALSDLLVSIGMIRFVAKG